ncbi:MAG: SGNH/GDSL hydrolase family protein [Gammaproteobacteria bacterium]|nr:SGNH/GDSL hydrolase family protein [Gammaproteobacteria bacterium]
MNNNPVTQPAWKQNILLSFFSVFFLFAILEIALRAYDAYRGMGFFSNHRNLLTHDREPLKPFRMFGFDLYRQKDGERFISSRHGKLFPVRKPVDTYRIVVFGGSTTENGYAQETAGIHYPLIMENELRQALNTDRIEVINLGNSAYATTHSLILFELDVLSWNPDMIIVSHNINDLLVSYWPDFTFDYSNKYSDDFYMGRDSDTYSTMNALMQHSAFYWFVYDRIKRLQGNIPLQRESYGMDLPEDSKAVFKRNLDTIWQLAKANDIKLVLGTQALESSEEYFRLHMDFKPYNKLIKYPLQEEFVNHHRIFNNIIKQVAAENKQITLVDNNPLLDDQKEYFVDLVHYTPLGVETLGRNYAATLLREGAVNLVRKNSGYQLSELGKQESTGDN